MQNPWLSIPLSDYEEHMGSEQVQQLRALAELFSDALRRCRPESVAILGIGGGNGLDRIDTDVTRRIAGVDVNPAYLEAARERYANLRGLELHCVDLSRQRVAIEPVQLVHAALIFEHAGTEICLENAMRLTAPGGHLAVVLQLPAKGGQAVGGSGVASMEALKSHFTLVDPEHLQKLLKVGGFHLVHESKRDLPGGKAFCMSLFEYIVEYHRI
ncbi:MAG TPA: class I SAM-dependent methyltransferase [Terriglobales bacterium]|nr:class I SAM-dependent methyltransferase [Terriglobales bacterium]